jgi:hypothetical protein
MDPISTLTNKEIMETEFYTFALFRGQSRHENYKEYNMFLLVLLQWLVQCPSQIETSVRQKKPC